MNHIYYVKADRGGYDSYDAHIVIADSPEKVIELVKENPGDETEHAWLIENVELIGTPDDSQEAGIVLSSFNAG